MVQSVLGSLVLGYRPLWNAARKLAGIQLYVHSDGATLVDAAHLLRTLQSLILDPGDPVRTGPELREYLQRWLR